MISKNEVKYIRSLGQQKGRMEAGAFLAEGAKLVTEMILHAPRQIQKIYATADFIQTLPEGSKDIPVVEVDQLMLDRLSQLQSPHQALAVMKKFDVRLPDHDVKQWMLLLDGIQDPGNMGTMIRIADWFGIRHILCTRDCADCYNGKVVQASMGSLARVGVHVIDPSDWMPHYKGPVVGALLDGVSAEDFSFPTYGLMVIGREGAGIRPEMRSCLTHSVSIPSFGQAESLNAAVAAGILLWETRRGGKP